MKKTPLFGTAVTVLTLMAGTASAQDCTFETDPFDMDDAEVAALYACVEADLAAAYSKNGDEIGSVYRDWQPAATGPAAPGPHGNRFLNTFANETAFALYTEYGYGDDFVMPVGSILAKESYTLRDNGEPRLGPLFIMTKVEAGEADEFGNWVYSGVQPNGNPMRVSQSFCHDCHVAFQDQDSLGYPAPHVRLGAN